MVLVKIRFFLGPHPPKKIRKTRGPKKIKTKIRIYYLPDAAPLPRGVLQWNEPQKEVSGGFVLRNGILTPQDRKQVSRVVAMVENEHMVERNFILLQ